MNAEDAIAALRAEVSGRRHERLAALALARGETPEATLGWLLRMATGMIPRKLPNLGLLRDMEVVASETFGDSVAIKLESGETFHGHPSSVLRIRQYYLIKDRLPKVLRPDAFGLLMDVVDRYRGHGTLDNRHLPGAGATIVEAGAYIGLKALRYARRVGASGRVLAIEIDRHNFELMCRNIEAHGLEEVITPVHCAVSDSNGAFEAIHRGYQLHSLVKTEEHDYAGRRTVQARRLDRLLGEQGIDVVDYLNLQVNGAEIAALEGLGDRLGRVRAFNIGTGYTVEGVEQTGAVVAWLRKRGLVVDEAGQDEGWVAAARGCGRACSGDSMNDLAITLDVDWAPDFVIDDCAERLVARGVRASWFVTHASPAIERIAAHPDLFELGIHPNFLAGSTHGSGHEAILDHCMELVPGARSMRTHGLYQSTPMLDLVARRTPVEFDVSLYLPRHPNLGPIDFPIGGRRIVRFPYMWEDDLEMLYPDPIWELRSLEALGAGLKILDFHPIHVYLNSASMDAYEVLKSREPKLARATRAEAADLVQPGWGTGAFFDAVLESGIESMRIADLAARAGVAGVAP